MLKTPEEILLIKQSAEILSQVHGHIAPHIHAGITTQQINDIAKTFIEKIPEATASFKNYQNFPAETCISVNDQVVHGIPNNYVLKEGDIVSVDCGICYKGYHTDAAYTYGVGNIKKELLYLLSITKQALYKGIEQATVGNNIGDIGYTIQQFVTKHGYTVVKEYTGHGLGKKLHEPPNIPNYGKKGEGEKIKEGMVLAIEPMVNLGISDILHIQNDPWNVRTLDKKPSAHFEHTIAIVKGKPEIQTNYKYIEQALK